MKFHLLVAASALVVGLGANGAFAGNDDHHGSSHDPQTTDVGVAVALSNQVGADVLNFAKGTVGTNNIGTVGGAGLVNIQQNNGANSILQDQNTLGAILNCSCSSSNDVLNVSLAASNQAALVLGNVSVGASNSTSKGGEAAAGSFSSSASFSQDGSDSHGHDRDSHSRDDGSKKFSEHSRGSFAEAAYWDNTRTAVGSSNTLSSFNGTGLYNISQNNGNNSMLQAGNTVAAIVGK